MTTNTIESLRHSLESLSCRSAWSRGVRDYAILLLDNLTALDPDDFASWSVVERALLNGADNWREHSEGGCALIYDEDIAQALCSPSELRRVRNGCRMPNREETWIDVQTRALYQAAAIIRRALLSD